MLIGITGTSGVLGAQLAKFCLDNAHQVRGIDRDEAKTKVDGVEVKTADLKRYDDVLTALKGCDAVIHAAAIPFPGRVEDHETHNNNVVVSYNVLLACAELKINRVVQMSSCNAIGMAYGRWERHYKHFPIDEDEPGEPADPYALSKAAHPEMRIASMRPSMCLEDYLSPENFPEVANWNMDQDELKGLAPRNECWSWTATPRTQPADKGAKFTSAQLAAKYFPNTPVRAGWFDADEGRGFFDCSKAEKLLDWTHK
ncbi:hypothetical protein OIV83_005642 [Microbotryomycetes sp. JL201]|nr:hypothetical protein OIV83_005642 [Microbotryomycetes sp. JL201]